MAEALKVNDEGVRGGSSGGNGGGMSSALAGLAEYPKRLRGYVHEVRVEMKQVNWPSRADVISTTMVVVVTVAFFAIFFALTDTILTRAANWLFHLASH
ncbi:MAG: preprotein translocase subunit SecE [Candidatus Acidiferrales bacterium]